MTTTQPTKSSYYEFERSLTSKCMARLRPVDLQHAYKSNFTTVRIIDVLPTGIIRESSMELQVNVFPTADGYQNRLAMEREALIADSKDIKTRLVLFVEEPRRITLFKDLYGVEFEIESSFFRACEGESLGDVFLGDEPPAFLDLGSKCCAKVIDQKFDHPLIKRGVNVGG